MSEDSDHTILLELIWQDFDTNPFNQNAKIPSKSG